MINFPIEELKYQNDCLKVFNYLQKSAQGYFITIEESRDFYFTLIDIGAYKMKQRTFNSIQRNKIDTSALIAKSLLPSLQFFYPIEWGFKFMV